MSWQLAMEKAEKTLDSSSVPSSLELISLIKKVNPTKLCLTDAERARGYEIKTRLQNLLLEQYGEAFFLAPDPLNPNIVLIKHAVLPTIDACHTELCALSCKALDSIAEHAHPSVVDPPAAIPHKEKRKNSSAGESAQEALQSAENCLAQYDYERAGEILCRIRASSLDEVATVERAARVLLEEIGAPAQAVEMLLAQQSDLLQAARPRALLARAYHLAGAFPEARSILDGLHVEELDKEALVAYADIARKDGNLGLAYRLVRVAEEARGVVNGLKCLKNEVETALHAEVEPLVESALSALDAGQRAEAEILARQVLQLCPIHEKAREIVAQIDSEKRTAEVDLTWKMLEQAEAVQERLELLEALLLRDPGNQEKITDLIQIEKARQKKELAQGRLERLRTLAREGAWRGSFDIVWWLQDQEDQHELAREGCEMSPYLSLLQENRRLRRLSQKNARQLWLDTVKAMADLQSGQAEPVLEIFETAKRYFEKYQVFQEAYQHALKAAQEKAREEIKDLLHLAAQEETGLSQAENCYTAIRKAVIYLPAEEGEEYCRIIKERIAELTRDTEGDLLATYKRVALSGCHNRAAFIRSYISDEAALEACDREVAAELKIERAPVDLEFSDSLQVDLLSDQPLLWIGSTDRHILLREADDAIVIVHLEKMRATRFTSANFKDLHLADSIPLDETFLFLNRENLLPRWRAELSEETSAFTSQFDLTALREHDDYCPVDIYLSSERANEYYAMIYDMELISPARVARRRLWSRSPVSDCIKVANAPQAIMQRLSSHPDRFIIGADGIMKACARNLTADYSVDISPKDIWAIDLTNRHLYYFDQAILKRTDFDWKVTEKYLNSGCCFFFKEHRKLGLCPATNTLMVGLGSRAALYDFSCNRISSYFGWGRVIGTRPARKWYTYAYSKERGTLTLRDVTTKLDTLLEWEEAEIPLDGRDKKNPEWEVKLHKQIYFGFTAEDMPEKPPGGEKSQ